MRALRMLYLMLVYIFALPIGLLFTGGLFIKLCIYNAKNFGETFHKDILEAYAEGFKEGHKMNMEWVKTGNLNAFI